MQGGKLNPSVSGFSLFIHIPPTMDNTLTSTTNEGLLSSVEDIEIPNISVTHTPRLPNSANVLTVEGLTQCLLDGFASAGGDDAYLEGVRDICTGTATHLLPRIQAAMRGAAPAPAHAMYTPPQPAGASGSPEPATVKLSFSGAQLGAFMKTMDDGDKYHIKATFGERPVDISCAPIYGKGKSVPVMQQVIADLLAQGTTSLSVYEYWTTVCKPLGNSGLTHASAFRAFVNSKTNTVLHDQLKASFVASYKSSGKGKSKSPPGATAAVRATNTWHTFCRVAKHATNTIVTIDPATNKHAAASAVARYVALSDDIKTALLACTTPTAFLAVCETHKIVSQTANSLMYAMLDDTYRQAIAAGGQSPPAPPS
jgi:hypothetical protein